MRARNIKPGFFKNDLLAECDPLARILFAGLWCYCDRNGCFEWRPNRIKAELLPYDNVDVEKLLAQLQKFDFIRRHDVDGQVYGWITKFKEHQNPHVEENAIYPPHPDDREVKYSRKQTEGAAKIPFKNQIPKTKTMEAPDEHHTTTVQTSDKHQTNPAESLLPQTESRILNTDSLTLNEDAKKLCECWIKLVQESDPKAKLLDGDRNLMGVFREKESDRTLNEIKKVMRYARTDNDFWKARTARLAKFVEHFPTLAQLALEPPKRGYKVLK